MDLLLVEELCQFIARFTADYEVEMPDGTTKSPQIVNGFLPPKRDDDRDDDEEPMILIRLADGQDEWHEDTTQAIAVAHTTIIVRTAAWDVTKGPQQTLNLTARIRQRIYASPILAHRYRAIYPLKWKAPEGNTFPLWQGEMTVPWIVPIPQNVQEVYTLVDEKSPA